MMPGIHPSESEPLLIERLASLDLDVVAESFTPRIIRDGIDAIAPAIRRAMSVERQRLFLILHEYATALDFGQHLLLTPHVLRAAPSNHIPIAYLPYNVGTPVSFAERTIVASFRGAVGTDPRGVRAQLFSRWRTGASPVRGRNGQARAPVLHGDNIIIVEDSGDFHDHHNDATRNENRNRYIDLLANSKIALCPRGAGASTFRFWEALAMGCVPLLIADDLVLPLEDRIDWNAIVLRIAERDVDALPELLALLDEERLARMADEGHRIWSEWFSPENWIHGVAAAVTLRR